MIDINKCRRQLLAQMILGGVKKNDIAEHLGLTKPTITKRFRDWEWTTMEARELVLMLGMDYKTASAIFFGDDVAEKETI